MSRNRLLRATVIVVLVSFTLYLLRSSSKAAIAGTSRDKRTSQSVGLINDTIKTETPEEKGILIPRDSRNTPRPQKLITGTNRAVPQWIHVSKELSVYSAFWDARVEPFVVRVVGMGVKKEKNTRYNLPVRCHVEIRNGSERVDVTTWDVTYEELGDSHDMNYVPILIECVPNTSDMPFRVGFSSTEKRNAISTITWMKLNDAYEVKNNDRDAFDSRIKNNARSDLTICVRPLFGNYNNLYEIVEFIAFYEILGANKFIFYDYSVSDSVKNALGQISRLGINITLLPWDLLSVEGMWAVGQTASVQDCLYRSAANSRFVLLVDLDEFVVPRKSDTIKDMIALLDGPSKGSFVFRHSAFCLEFASKYPDRGGRIPLLTQYKVTRLKELGGLHYRTKYLTKPETVLTAGIHSVTRFLNEKFEEFLVPAEMGLLQHYRSDTVPCLSAHDTDTVEDGSARRFSEKLFTSRVIKILEDRTGGS